ncbi:hypothetical protein COOONC_09448, partial [Cooperia oncophora]
MKIIFKCAVQQCSDYLRCRSDEIEVRWRCVDANRPLLSDFCRVERHIRSLKALVIRRESDFADCIATEAHTADDSEIVAEGMCLCTGQLKIPSRPSCEDLKHGTTSRCEDLRKCCAVSKTCGEQQHSTKISSMLIAQKTTVATLLQ